MTADRGSVSVLMVAFAGVVAVVALATASIAVAYAARTQAATAADAAALAAAVATYPSTGRGDPEREAASVARNNGAELEACRCRVDPELVARTVYVVTFVPIELPLFGRLEVKAASGAEFDPRLWLGR